MSLDTHKLLVNLKILSCIIRVLLLVLVADSASFNVALLSLTCYPVSALGPKSQSFWQFSTVGQAQCSYISYCSHVSNGEVLQEATMELNNWDSLEKKIG